MRTALRWTGRVLATLLILLVIAALVGLGYRAWRHSEAERALAIDDATGIDEARFVRVGDTEQWIWIRGRNRANPILLVVHGGPGNTTAPIATRFLPFESEYTVVHWDQAGAGKTFAHAGRFDPVLTIERIVQDGVVITEFLRAHLQRDRVIVLGWSWGSLIGAEMVRTRPDLFAAYVGTGQVVNSQKGEALAYTGVLAEARRCNNARAIEDLEAIGPPPYEAQREVAVQRTWASEFEGSGNLFVALLDSVVSAPHYSLSDTSGYFRGLLASQNHFLGERMDGPLTKVDLTAEPTNYEVPVFVIDGAEDNYTPADLARDYVAMIAAPQKDFVTIAGAGHLALITHGDEFRRLMNERLRALH